MTLGQMSFSYCAAERVAIIVLLFLVSIALQYTYVLYILCALLFVINCIDLCRIDQAAAVFLFSYMNMDTS